MVITDILGRELKVGDIVANATKCTSTAYLRRSIIKKRYDYIRYDKYRYIGFDIKSLIIGDRWGWNNGKYEKLSKKVICGNTSEGNSFTITPEGNLPTHLKLNVIRLGSLEEAFTPEEIEILKQSNTKLNYE